MASSRSWVAKEDATDPLIEEWKERKRLKAEENKRKRIEAARKSAERRSRGESVAELLTKFCVD